VTKQVNAVRGVLAVLVPIAVAACATGASPQAQCLEKAARAERYARAELAHLTPCPWHQESGAALASFRYQLHPWQLFRHEGVGARDEPVGIVEGTNKQVRFSRPFLS
jgi:hypothetical protein